MNTGHHVFTEADGALPSSPPICGGSESSHSTTILGRGATWMDSASRNKLKGELGMKMRFVVMIAVAALVVLVGLLFWNGPHGVRGASQNIVVLCSSCTFEGLPREGHLVVMDGNSGDVWLYSDAAMEGKENPIHWGKLVLGQKLVRATQ